MRRILAISLGLAAAATPFAAPAAVHNSLILNEANTVTGDKFLDDQNRNRSDLFFGRVEGNGQNWLEFLVVQGDEKPGGGFSNTLDLRDWRIDWSYDKNDATDPNQRGAGTIRFTQDSQWAVVPVGTLITVTEWKQVWYHDAGTDPGHYGGMKRDGGVNGLGTPKGDAYDGGPTAGGVHQLRNLSTDVAWNPRAFGGAAAGDWHMQLWAGERNPDQSYKYFTFDGEIIDGDPAKPIAIGTEAGGLFVVNNDNWQWSIHDADGGDAIQGPIGEALSAGAWSVNSQEIFRLEDFTATVNPTQATYLSVTAANYQDGSSSAFSRPNNWSGGSLVQSLAPLRGWLEDGDADLDGQIGGGDFLAWQRGFGLNQTNASPAARVSWTQGDLTGDGKVNAADLDAWKQNFGAHVGVAGAAVPECSSALLAGIVVASLARRRGCSRP